jgi:methionine-gamma-lyase
MRKARKAYRNRSIGRHRLHPETLMMSYGYEPKLSEGAIKCPIFQTSTFVFKKAEDGKAFFEHAYGRRARGVADEPGLIYSRINNPDLEILEDRLTLWDQAKAGLVFSSGMAAISTTLLTFVRPGDVIVHSQPVYGGTDFLLRRILPRFGIESIDFHSGPGGRSLEAAAADAVERGRLSIIFVETPANPTNHLVDIARCAEIARSIAEKQKSRPLVIVDNTLLGPLWQQPLRHGADLVVYSLTKYVGGHSDVIAGGCLGADAHVSAVRGMRTILGTMLDPNSCWLLMRSLETLKLRMTASMTNAREIAEFLRGHPKVRQVHFLDFLGEDDDQRATFARQCTGPGSTFSFEVRGGKQEAFRVLNRLKLVKLAVSLGGTESLIEHPATMTHSDIAPAKQREIGITQSMLRLSVGIEHPNDLIADLAQALDAA